MTLFDELLILFLLVFLFTLVSYLLFCSLTNSKFILTISKLNTSIILTDQQPVKRYLKYLPILQSQIQPRGVGDNPVYSNGVNAFRNIDSVYRCESMEPEEYALLKGLYTPLVDTLNALFFGRQRQCGFIIDKSQQDSFARMMVRLHVIDQIKIWLIDGSKFVKNSRKIKEFCPIIDLRGYPLQTVRKLMRWKKEYSPAFDGLIRYDRLDQLIAGIVPVRDGLVKRSASTKAGSNNQVSDTLKWNWLFTKAQAQQFSQDQRAQFASCQADYRKWCLFCKDIRYTSQYAVRVVGRLNKALQAELESNRCFVKYYAKDQVTFITPCNRTGNRLSWINDNLDRNLMLKLLKVLAAPSFF